MVRWTGQSLESLNREAEWRPPQFKHSAVLYSDSMLQQFLGLTGK